MAENKIKIGSQTFKITHVTDLHNGSNELDGWLQPWKSSITLDTRLDVFSTRQTLWHEIIHQLVNLAGIKEVVPESAIDSLSYGIIQILEDNKFIRSLKEN